MFHLFHGAQAYKLAILHYLEMYRPMVVGENTASVSMKMHLSILTLVACHVG